MRAVKVAAILLVLAVAGAVLLSWYEIRRGFSARETPSSIETLAATTARRLAVPSSYRQLHNPLPASPANIQAGMEHFADHCAICHANDGSGKTTIGQGLYPKAPDMRLPETRKLSDGEIYYIIHNGIRLTGMPAWGESHHDEDSWKLVLFIRHLPYLTPEEEKDMESLNPKSAMERVEEEEEEQFLVGGNTSDKNEKQHHRGGKP